MDDDVDFERAMEEDLTGATHCSVADYARHAGMAPQMVHYWIRSKVIQKERCQCGRWVIDIKAADEAIQAHKKA